MIAVYNKGILSWDQYYQKVEFVLTLEENFYVEGIYAVIQIDNLIKKFAFLIKCSLINACIKLNICSDCTR